MYYTSEEENYRIVKEINYNKIKHCEYYRFIALLLGDSKGGKLVVYYLEDGIEKSIEISFLKKLMETVDGYLSPNS